jgi:tyrosyl-tRNA synthetase
MSGKNVFGLTAPLVVKSDGGKFGKTETGTIWLDKNKTSVYEFYQFFINTPDNDVIKFIKYFTFLSKVEIEKIEKEMQSAPEKRNAQKILAQELTKIVHGEKELKKVEKITQILFNGDIKKLKVDEIKMAFSGVPSFENSGKERLLVDLLVDAEIVKSKREARENISNNAVSLNGKKCNDLEKNINKKDFLFGKYLVVKKGKKNYFLIKW